MSEYVDRSDQHFPAGSWRTSSFCGPNGGNCVEVNLGSAGIVGIRDTKPISSPALMFSINQWHAFVGSTREGHYSR